jgi:hypothetical protein
VFGKKGEKTKALSIQKMSGKRKSTKKLAGNWCFVFEKKARKLSLWVYKKRRENETRVRGKLLENESGVQIERQENETRKTGTSIQENGWKTEHEYRKNGWKTDTKSTVNMAGKRNKSTGKMAGKLISWVHARRKEIWYQEYRKNGGKLIPRVQEKWRENRFLKNEVERVAADDLEYLLLVLDGDDADHQLQLAGHQPLQPGH